MDVLHAYMSYNIYMHSLHKMISDSVELELQMVVSCFVGSRK